MKLNQFFYSSSRISSSKGNDSKSEKWLKKTSNSREENEEVKIPQFDKRLDTDKQIKQRVKSLKEKSAKLIEDTKSINEVREEKWEFPSFMQPDKRKDKNKRKPNDQHYDNRSVYISEAEFSQMTAGMIQYWKIKQNNMDKIVLFRRGLFYEAFNEDAIVCHHYLNLNWTGMYHIGFPDKVLNKYAGLLVDKGYRVIIIDQMETPKEMKKRLEKPHGKKDKALKREVCQFFSRGTRTDSANYEARYLISVYTDYSKIIGVIVLDIAALKIRIGQFENDL
jgi:DNA mismatch repair protein MSH6